MPCLKDKCKFWKYCRKFVGKKEENNKVIYNVVILPYEELPEECPIREYLRGRWHCMYIDRLIDELRIYSRALSYDEIKKLYEMGVKQSGK